MIGTVPQRPDAFPPAGWYCVKAKSKQEHLAAHYLLHRVQVETFCPRIRFQRGTQRGKVWFTEPLFPGYFFAYLDLVEHLREVTYTPGVYMVVHFGYRYPQVPDSFIEALQDEFPNGIKTLPSELKTGDRAQVTGGPLHGLEAVVQEVLPGKQRVRLLLDFLGQQLEAEIDDDYVIRKSESDAKGANES